jgi:hypothetical protein
MPSLTLIRNTNFPLRSDLLPFISDQRPKRETFKAGNDRHPWELPQKEATVLQLLRRKHGASIAEIANTTGWQNHTIRGFISGTLTKRMGLIVESSMNNDGGRTYRVVK